MVKSTKTERIRERMRGDIKSSKQFTLNSVPEPQKAEKTKAATPEQKKQIEVTEMSSSTLEDELVLKVGFKLLPSRTAFSRVTADLYFDEQKIDSLRLEFFKER